MIIQNQRRGWCVQHKFKKQPNMDEILMPLTEHLLRTRGRPSVSNWQFYNDKYYTHFVGVFQTQQEAIEISKRLPV